MIIEIIDSHSEYDGLYGKILYNLDNCGFMVVEIFKNKKHIFINEKQFRILCIDEIMTSIYIFGEE